MSVLIILFTGYRTHFNSKEVTTPPCCIGITIDDTRRGCTLHFDAGLSPAPPRALILMLVSILHPHTLQFDASLPLAPSCTSISMPVGGDLPPAPLCLSISTLDSLTRQGGCCHLLEQFAGPQVPRPIKTHTRTCTYKYGFLW